MSGLSHQVHDWGQLRGTPGRNTTKVENFCSKLALKCISLESVPKGSVLINLEEKVSSLVSFHKGTAQRWVLVNLVITRKRNLF